jgi:hypothetical protein
MMGDPVLVTADTERQVIEAEPDALIVETALVGPAGPPGGGEGLAEEIEAREQADAELQADAAAAQATADAALPKAGGTLTGPLTLAGDPATNLQAATRQYVAAQIAALIDGAPGALDTLKELADKLGSEATAIEALTAVVTGKLAASSNLADLVDAVAARANLGLGSAATHPVGDFQPTDADLTAIAALSTAPFGRSLLELANAGAGLTALGAAAASHTHAEADITGLVADLEQIERRGLPAKWWWAMSGLVAGFGTATVGAGGAGLFKFVPRRNMTVRGLSFITTVAATANDECAVAMKAANGKTNLAGSGAVAGKLNATVGRQDVDFLADVELVAGTTYCPAFQQNTIGGTAATFASWNLVATQVAALIGSAPGEAFCMSANPTFPFATEPAPGVSSARPLLIVRER